MAITNTTYLGLNKPDYDAIADIEVLNDNADIIDEQFDGTHLVSKVNNVTPVGGAVTIDLGVTSVNGMTGAVTITERSVKQLIDIIYPVGSYYETTNTNFNPNTAWSGTTWQRISDGRTLIAGGGSSGYTVGSTYGAKTHAITTAEMPIHKHTVTAASVADHTHGPGTYKIVGQIKSTDDNEPLTFSDSATSSGALSLGGYHNDWAHGNTSTATGDSYEQINLQADSSHGWSGASAANGGHTHTMTVSNTGSGTAMSLVQPSQAVARWLRTA